MGMKKAPLIEMLRSTIKIVLGDEVCRSANNYGGRCLHLLHDAVFMQVFESLERDSRTYRRKDVRRLPDVLSDIQTFDVSVLLQLYEQLFPTFA